MKTDALINELKFSTARSAGSGGQHVNKTETKVQLIFDVDNSEVLTEKEKMILYQNLANKITKNGLLRMSSQVKRSQVWNKRIVIQRFVNMVQHALKPQKLGLSARLLNFMSHHKSTQQHQQIIFFLFSIIVVNSDIAFIFAPVFWFKTKYFAFLNILPNKRTICPVQSFKQISFSSVRKYRFIFPKVRDNLSDFHTSPIHHYNFCAPSINLKLIISKP